MQTMRRVWMGLVFVVLAVVVIVALGTAVAGGASEYTEMRPTPINKFAVVASGLAALAGLRLAFVWQDRIRGLGNLIDE